jgi:ATP-dependent RNA helicase DeaD
MTNNFEKYNFPLCLNQALERLAFKEATPIQQELIPLALEGKDILGSAQTGSGKTAAYLLPLLTRLLANNELNALILVPTRELANQVTDVAVQLTERAPQIRIAKVTGGARMGQQIQKLSRGPRLIVATPGRLNDHLNRFHKLLKQTGILVLDEADRMLDMGFAPQLERILQYLPKERQSLLLSATLPQKILKLSAHFLNSPVSVSIAQTEESKPQIEESSIEIDHNDKPGRILDVMKDMQGTVLIFARTQIRADKLARHLDTHGHTVDSLHGGKTQGQRNRILQRFRDGEAKVLVATDLAARGIDVPHVAHVINFDLPLMAEDYVHRIGRTGRAGKSGKALSFIASDERQLWRAIRRLQDGVEPELEQGSRPGGGRGGFGGKRKFGRKQMPSRLRNKFKGAGEGSERPARFGGGERSDRPARFGGGERSERPARFGGGERNDRPARFGGGERSERPARFGGGERSDRPARFGGGERSERPARFGGGERSERPARFGGGERSDRPARFGGGSASGGRPQGGEGSGERRQGGKFGSRRPARDFKRF